MKSGPSNGNGRSAFLFAWNPQKWNIHNIEQCILELKESGSVIESWTCLNQRATVGDRAFLMKVGAPPRGIMGSGTIVSKGMKMEHWDDPNKIVNSVYIEFDTILHPDYEEILPAKDLKEDELSAQWWRIQSSGIIVKSDVLPHLEKKWARYAQKARTNNRNFSDKHFTPKTYVEGTITKSIVTRYERDGSARKKCLEKHGYDCSACMMNFERTYGKLGRDFIHVHHIEQISAKGGSYSVDPEKDLIPLCPNCHAMVHRQNPPLTIDALKRLLESYK